MLVNPFQLCVSQVGQVNKRKQQNDNAYQNDDGKPQARLQQHRTSRSEPGALASGRLRLIGRVVSRFGAVLPQLIEHRLLAYAQDRRRASLVVPGVLQRF